METLHLTLKKELFDMILKGEKREEYRECKPHYHSRLRTKGTYLIKRFDVVGMSLKGHTFRKDAIHHAIQDRQSVLEDRKKELKHFRDTLHSNVFTLIAFDIEKRITNLTEQINYLKSKL